MAKQNAKLKPRQTIQERLEQLKETTHEINHSYFVGKFQDEMKAIEQDVKWYHYFLWLLLFTVLGAVYVFILSANFWLSLVTGFILSFFAIQTFAVLPKKQQYRLDTLSELNNYASTVVFNLEAGENPYNALQMTTQYLREPVLSEVQKTVEILEETAELDTEHMKQYRFAPLDIFHQTLAIKRDQGGNAKVLFDNTLDSLNFYVVKHDELSKRKKYVRKQIFMIMAIAGAIPLVVRYAAPNEFLIFQENIFGQIMAVLVLILFFVLAAKTQREALELDLI
ncbi:MAG: type II secretion system F family protein [Culicoidibacterales bacterium]